MTKAKSVLLQANLNDRSSFSIVTAHLARGLEQLGYRITIFPNEEGAKAPEFVSQPDIYIFHGFPYDAKNAPGRLNIFHFTYEYLDLESRYTGLVERLNAYFDLIVVPSVYVKEICHRNGISIPVEVVPHGVDRSEFNPDVTPVRLPTSKRFRFLNLGEIADRKGTDVLLRAYLEEFTAADDVSLIIKARTYEFDREWAEGVIANAGIHRPGAPEVILRYHDDPSVAGYYTAVDVGVFPHRSEGFGLCALECLASGRRVIVTGGTGEMDYCSAQNSRFVKTTVKFSAGRRMLEPDVASLRTLMRQAFERGPSSASAQAKIVRSVRRFTWERSCKKLDVYLRRAWKAKTDSVPKRAPDSRQVVTYCFAAKGRVSWKRLTLEIDALLRKQYQCYTSVPYSGALPSGPSDLVVGQSEFCLEGLLRAAHLNPQVRRIVHQEGTALERRIAITNRERKRCGVPLIEKRPIELWRNKMECDLADYIVVGSRAAARYFLDAGHSEEKVRVIPCGIDLRKPVKHRAKAKRRFLFAGTEPFRKGIRLLLEAWNALRPPGAELWCFTSDETFLSRKLLRYVVANPSIIVRPLTSPRVFQQVSREIDCHVLPSLEDSFPVVISDGMGCGVPAIVSDHAGISDLIVNRENGLIVSAGSVQELIAAIDLCCSNPRLLRDMGEAAYETARQYSWARFRNSFLTLTESCLKRPAIDA